MDSDSEDEEVGGHHEHDHEDGTDVDEGMQTKVKSKLERISVGSAMERSTAEAEGFRDGGGSTGRPSLERVSQGSRRSTDSCLGKRSAAGDDTPAGSMLSEQEEEVRACYARPVCKCTHESLLRVIVFFLDSRGFPYVVVLLSRIWSFFPWLHLCCSACSLHGVGPTLAVSYSAERVCMWAAL